MAGDGTDDEGTDGAFRCRTDPAGAGRAGALLRAWHAIETLTPRTYRREGDLAAGGEAVRMSDRRLPWPVRRPPRKNHVAYHQAYLGAIEMGPATRRLLEAMDGPDHRPGAEGPADRGGSMAAIASVLLDADGVPVEGGVSVSSFAWALPAYLAGDLARIGRWAEAERHLADRVAGILRKPLPDGGLAPLGIDDIRAAHAWLVSTLGLPAEIVVPPTFACRILVHEKARSDPGPAILNSHFLGDIDRAAAALDRGRLPAAARAYLGVDAPAAPVDVLADKAALTRLLDPSAFPPARWPPAGGAALATLQQAAANAAGLLAEGAGVLAVNGPPGTGKTTLLRDVVASCILRRAEAMCAHERPEAAFAAAEGTFEARGRRIAPHRLDPALKGHEVLVASSNNRAVENISRELPSARALGPGAGDLRHFRALSDAIARMAADPRGDGRPLRAGDRTWGLAAAVLGRSSNRRDFVETFWWDPDHGIRTWLSLALGEPVTIRVPGEDGAATAKRQPALLAVEDPPLGPGQAQERWLAARADFLACRARVRQALDAAGRAARSESRPARTLAEAEADCADLAEAGRAAAEAVRAAADALAAAETAEGAARRLASSAADAGDDEASAAGLRILAGRATAASDLAEARRRSLKDAQDARSDLAERWRDAAAAVRRLSAPPDGGGAPGVPVDAAFFDAGHEAWNRAAPWLDAPAHAARDALFAAAMRVHEAFVLAAAGPVRANLAGFVAATGGPAPGLEAHLGDLWSTLFLVVPVVSTTFASVERMLDGLPDEALGWLVVDEAGQAAPQAALGAIMRCRRAVVVGDPLQVEPVATLPEAVAARLCAEHGLDAALAAAPDASAQTFADRASPFSGSFRDGPGRRFTGLPLLVHRRCAEPMFGIANAVAYDGQMVAGPPGREPCGEVAGILGPSRWIDVPPGAGGPARWRPPEGDALLDLLARLLDGRRPAPDLFVISPYREVADAARGLVRRQRRLFAASGVPAESWAADRIGTIHAFQGREAEAVVLLLGASGEGLGGTRRWAARTPNVLNVAVSRARERLYVVGDHASWRDEGCFRVLARALPAPRREPARAA